MALATCQTNYVRGSPGLLRRPRTGPPLGISANTLVEIKRWEFQQLRKILKLRRRPGEGCMEYNTRTSCLIVSWFHKYGVCVLHHRVLKQVFHGAWRENHHPDNTYVKHSSALRMYRARVWREGTRQIPWKRRRAIAAAQNVLSHPTEWEDVFCEVYGSQWWQLCDACPSSQVWRTNLEYFTNTVCQSWGLPELTARAASASDL